MPFGCKLKRRDLNCLIADKVQREVIVKIDLIDKIIFSNKFSKLSVKIVLNICNQFFVLLFLKFFYQQKHTIGKC